jgi:hypothetical protein
MSLSIIETILKLCFKAVTQGPNLMKANTAGQAKEKAEEGQLRQLQLRLCQSKIHKRRD